VDRNTWYELLTASGQQALQAAEALQPVEDDFLRHFTALQRVFPGDLARAALETAVLRREALGKFPFAEQMYFTRQALEQASSYEIAHYRARRYRGFERLFDLGCSVGCDTLALAEQAFTVGVDLDGLRLEMARSNLDALGLAERADIVQADLTTALPFARLSRTGVFFDPARRTDERRVFSVHDYQPPLGVIQGWLPKFPALGVKISPGVKIEELAGYDAEVEFISLHGQLKEAVLWFGPLKTAPRRATILPGEHTLVGEPDGAGAERLLPLSEPRATLYEPDPAVLRAGLVQQLGTEFDAAQLDPEIAYLTSDRRVETPFAHAWHVEAWMPFGVKPLRAALRQRGVEQVVVKKRGSPLKPEELIRALHLRQGEAGPASRVLFLTHLRGKPIVVICIPSA
jgi:SAM-dependent methyltransferase